jgi:hypothetical protein
MGGMVRRSRWGLAALVLLVLTGCMPASRGWVREQLAPMQAQLAEIRQRVAVVEQQFGRLDPKVDRILAQMEQQEQPPSLSPRPPADIPLRLSFPAPSHIPAQLPVEANLDFTITGEAASPAGEATPPPLAPGKALQPATPGHAAEPDCGLETLTGEPC